MAPRPRAQKRGSRAPTYAQNVGRKKRVKSTSSTRAEPPSAPAPAEVCESTVVSFIAHTESGKKPGRGDVAAFMHAAPRACGLEFDYNPWFPAFRIEGRKMAGITRVLNEQCYPQVRFTFKKKRGTAGGSSRKEGTRVHAVLSSCITHALQRANCVLPSSQNQLQCMQKELSPKHARIVKSVCPDTSLFATLVEDAEKLGLEPLATEVRVLDEDIGLATQIDAVFSDKTDPTKCTIVEFKTGFTKGAYTVFKADGPLHLHADPTVKILPNTAHHRHCLQASISAKLFEKTFGEYGLSVDRTYVVYLNHATRAGKEKHVALGWERSVFDTLPSNVINDVYQMLVDARLRSAPA